MLNFSIANYRRVLDKARLGAGIIKSVKLDIRETVLST